MGRGLRHIINIVISIRNIYNTCIQGFSSLTDVIHSVCDVEKLERRGWTIQTPHKICIKFKVIRLGRDLGSHPHCTLVNSRHYNSEKSQNCVSEFLLNAFRIVSWTHLWFLWSFQFFAALLPAFFFIFLALPWCYFLFSLTEAWRTDKVTHTKTTKA